MLPGLCRTMRRTWDIRLTTTIAHQVCVLKNVVGKTLQKEDDTPNGIKHSGVPHQDQSQEKVKEQVLGPAPVWKKKVIGVVIGSMARPIAKNISLP